MYRGDGAHPRTFCGGPSDGWGQAVANNSASAYSWYEGYCATVSSYKCYAGTSSGLFDTFSPRSGHLRLFGRGSARRRAGGRAGPARRGRRGRPRRQRTAPGSVRRRRPRGARRHLPRPEDPRRRLLHRGPRRLCTSAYGSSPLVARLSGRSFPEATKDPAVKKVFGRWSARMKAEAFTYADPTALFDDPRFGREPHPVTPLETSTALTEGDGRSQAVARRGCGGLGVPSAPTPPGRPVRRRRGGSHGPSCAGSRRSPGTRRPPAPTTPGAPRP